MGLHVYVNTEFSFIYDQLGIELFIKMYCLMHCAGRNYEIKNQNWCTFKSRDTSIMQHVCISDMFPSIGMFLSLELSIPVVHKSFVVPTC